MALQIKKKFIQDGAVDGLKILLQADQTLRRLMEDGSTQDVISYLENLIANEKSRVDSILAAADADKDSFAEIVALINSVDTENDQAFAAYVLSNDAALAKEVEDREAGDADLQAKIDAEIADRESGDQNIQSQITALQGAEGIVFEDNAAVYADGTAPIAEPSGQDGWYYKNDGQDIGSGGLDKINWYFFDASVQTETIGSALTGYAVGEIKGTEPFHLAVYTIPQGDGNDAGSWYRSRVVYIPTSGSYEQGKKYLFVTNLEDTPANLYPDLERVEMVPSEISTVGPMDESEQILTASIGTNSAAQPNTVEVLVNNVGYVSSVNGAVDTRFEIRGSFTLAGIKESLSEEEFKRQSEDERILSESKSYTDTKVSELVDSAPEVLDTLKELSDALGGDENFATTVANNIGQVNTKVDSETARIEGLVSDEEAARIAGDLILESSINAEEAARIAADSDLSARVDVLEALEPEEVFTYSSLAQFPSTGESSKVYIAQDSDKIYHWKSVQQSESFNHTVGASGDFPDLATALADASVLDGHKIKVLNGTYDLAAQLVISKQVQIFGESKAGVILQSSADGSAPVSLISVSASDVAIVDMTIKHRKTTNTSIENAITVSGDNFIMSNVQLEYMEFGIVSNMANDWLIKDCDFVYAGVAGNDNRPVGIYGMGGNCFVESCQFDDNGISANVKPIFMASQNTSGKLVIDGNSSVNNVHQFVVVENLLGSADSFDLVVKNNTTNETSAYILIAGDSNDVINSITVSGNTLSHSHTSAGGGKGIVTFYGIGDWGKIDLHQDNNTLQDEFFRSGYTLFSQLKDSLGNPITTGFSAGTSESFEPTIDVTLDDVIAANPAQSSVPSLGSGSGGQYTELSEQVDISGLEADLAAEEAARIAADDVIDGRLASLESFEYETETKVLSASDLNEIVFSKQIVEKSMVLSVGRLMLLKGIDYSLEVQPDNSTKLTFIGSVAQGGEEALAEGETLQAVFQHKV